MQHLPSTGGLETERLAVRDDLLRRARRGLPVLAVLAVLATVVALGVEGERGAVAAGPGQAPAAGATTVPGATVPGAAAPGATTADAGGAAPGATDPAGGPAPTVPGGQPAATPGAAAGVARSGVACAPGARQVPWSRYAPACVPAFAGDNGGATAPGVTADTITLSYRRQNTAQAAAVRALAGEATPVDAEYEHDLQVFLNLFNQQYELYGRRVELAPFNGRGDFLTEDLGQGQQAANADGVTARELGGFLDVTFPSAGSLFYSAALQAQGVMAYGFPLSPQAWYEQNAPYQYNVFLSGTAWAQWASNLVCQRLAGGPADFAGDPALHDDPRVFGLVAVEFPTWLAASDEVAAGIERQCGVTMARRASYAEDLGSMQQDANSIVAQLKAAGVTTVVCFCDPLLPIFLTDAASRQQFRPEWIVQNQFDPIAQVYDQSQWAHSIAPGPASVPPDRSEAYAAYKLADPQGEPASIYYQVAYEVLLHVFGTLQSAGPNLTPHTFRDGAFALPPSDGAGDFGIWGSGAGRYTPIIGVPVVRWDLSARSANGQLGSWRPCDEGTAYPFGDPAAWGSGPLRCPG